MGSGATGCGSGPVAIGTECGSYSLLLVEADPSLLVEADPSLLELGVEESKLLVVLGYEVPWTLLPLSYRLCPFLTLLAGVLEDIIYGQRQQSPISEASSLRSLPLMALALISGYKRHVSKAQIYTKREN
jgi:hypothetical protein